MLKGGMCEMPKYALIYAVEPLAAQSVNGGVIDELFEWKMVILNDFEIVWELCSSEWFNTIQNFLVILIIPKYIMELGPPTCKTIPVRVDTDIRYVM